MKGNALKLPANVESTDEKLMIDRASCGGTLGNGDSRNRGSLAEDPSKKDFEKSEGD